MEMPHENRLDWTVLMRGVKVSIDQQGRSSPNLPRHRPIWGTDR